MYLFKTKNSNFKSVIETAKHGYSYEPQKWDVGELVLVSKNKGDLQPDEKQIQYTMTIRTVRKLKYGESQRIWPGNEGNWNYLIECENTQELIEPFDLKDGVMIESGVWRG
jgi:hypothetical protein